MKVRKHFRTSSATIDYIIADFSLNRITDHDSYLYSCASKRIKALSEDYDARVDKILNFVIMYCDYTDMPMVAISKLLYSMSKIATVLSKGVISLL